MITRSSRAVSLHFAVADIAQAIHGVRMLIDTCAADGLSGSDTPRRGAEAAAAMLSIVGTHVDNCLRAMRGEADARVILTNGNAAPDEPLQDCLDLAVPVWESHKAFDLARAQGGPVGTATAVNKPKRRRGHR